MNSTHLTAEAAIPAQRLLYDMIVQIVVYATAVLVPVWYLPWTSSPLEYNKQMVLVILMAVGLITWLLGAVVEGKLTVRFTPIDKGVLALLAASLIATVFSLARAPSLYGISANAGSAFLTVLTLSVFYFLVVNSMHNRGRILRRALLISVGVALLLGTLQIFTVFILPGGFAHTRSFNTVGTLNTLGVLAAIVLPLMAKAAERSSGKLGKTLSIIGTALSVGILAILNLWVLWVIALVGMLAMIACDSLNVVQLAEDYGGRENRFTLSRLVVPVVVIVIGAFMMLVHLNFSSWKVNIPIEVTPSYRLSLHVATSVLWHRPITGWGPENFSLAFDRFGAGQLASTQLANARFYSATGELFSMIVQYGAVALLALAVLVWCLVQAVSRARGALFRSSGTCAALVAAAAAFCLYPFNLTLWFVSAALLALVALTVAGDRSRTVDIEERPMYSLAASLGFIVGLILVLSGIYVASVHYIADVRYAHALNQKTATAALDGLAGALNLNASSDQYLRDASQVTLALVREELDKKDTDSQRTQRIQNLIASAIQLAQRATVVRPDESLNWANLGQVYQSLIGLVDNVSQLSQLAYQKAAALRPGDPTLDNTIGQMWLAWHDLLTTIMQRSTAGDITKLREQSEAALKNAEESFKSAIEKSNTFGLAIYNLGAAYDREGKVKEAIAQLEKIAPYNTDQPTLMFELGLLYVRAGQKASAIAAFQRAVLLAPQYANARWYLALLLEDKGDISGALAQLREIQKTNEDSAVVQQKIEQLEAGQRQIPPEKVIDTKPLE